VPQRCETFGDLGAWLSLVERFVRDEEVARSNRVAPKFSSADELRRGPGDRLFSNFNLAARRVLRVAEQECRNHSHYYVGAEHLLVALLEEPDPSTVSALDAAGVDVPEVHAEARRALGTGEERLWEGILITPRVRRIIALAEERAAGREVGPLDLFEALRLEGGSSAAEILRRATSRNTASTVE
jgi:ATP-dependent Clp protease ATP-binding subunit ClpA